MSKELKMEVFASKEPVKSVKLHVYEFHTSELYENKYRLIRSAVWKRMGNCHMGYRILCMDVDSKGNP